MASNKVHDDFQQEIQKAWEEYIIKDIHDLAIPEPDLSFLKQLPEKQKNIDKSEDMQLELLSLKRKHSSYRRFTKVAIILLAILVTSSAIGIFLNSESSYGVKNFFQNVKHLLSEDEPIVNENDVKTLSVSDWNEIENGRKVVGELYVPEYIPKGYTFDKAIFDNIDTIYKTSYSFINGEKELRINIQGIKDDTDIYVAGDPQKSPISGRAMYVEEDEEGCAITYIKEKHNFCVISRESKQETFKIIEGITKKAN